MCMVKDVYKRQLYGGKNVFETRVLKADGSSFWASGIIEKTLDGNGAFVMIATFHDITEEKMCIRDRPYALRGRGKCK